MSKQLKIVVRVLLVNIYLSASKYYEKWDINSSKKKSTSCTNHYNQRAYFMIYSLLLLIHMWRNAAHLIFAYLKYTKLLVNHRQFVILQLQFISGDKDIRKCVVLLSG